MSKSLAELRAAAYAAHADHQADMKTDPAYAAAERKREIRRLMSARRRATIAGCDHEAAAIDDEIRTLRAAS